MPRKIAGLEAREWHRRYRDKNRDSIRHFVQERLSGWRRHGPSDLTTDYLVELYNQQGGRCYFTECVLVFNRGRGGGHALPGSISLDRLTPHKGYNQGNVVWCCYLANTMKQRMSEKAFLTLLRRILHVAEQREAGKPAESKQAL